MSDTCKEIVYKEIYAQYSTYLRNFLYYKCGNLNMAEDLSHDAYIKLWENCAKVPYEKAKSYLFTIANNLFINKMHHQNVVLQFEQKGHSQKDLKDPEYILEENEFRVKLERAISDLPEGQRVVFLMNRIDKKKYREIAEELGISQKAVEKRMHNALSKLRNVHSSI